jgi:hypothetical protein
LERSYPKELEVIEKPLRNSTAGEIGIGLLVAIV